MYSLMCKENYNVQLNVSGMKKNTLYLFWFFRVGVQILPESLIEQRQANINIHIYRFNFLFYYFILHVKCNVFLIINI